MTFLEGQLDHKDVWGMGVDSIGREEGGGGCDGIAETYDRGPLLEYQKMDAVSHRGIHSEGGKASASELCDG